MKNQDNSKKRIKIEYVSQIIVVFTIILMLLSFFIIRMSISQVNVLQHSIKEYGVCQDAAEKLEDASKYLTEQVQMYAKTGEKQYMDSYYEEVNVTKRRDIAVETLRAYFNNTEIEEYLQSALNKSNALMETEYYSMRLAAEAYELPNTQWPQEVININLTVEDQALSNDEKAAKAVDIVTNNEYEKSTYSIYSQVNDCMTNLIKMTKSKQNNAISVFIGMFLKINIGLIVFILLLISILSMLQNLVINPLIQYNESIKLEETFPLIGAEEIQKLAKTYNRMFTEYKETQKLLRHEAEHDALTNVLSRNSYDKLIKIYEEGQGHYALIKVDVLNYNEILETQGKSMANEGLKRVSSQLIRAFRNVDYICRIDEASFAVIMIDMNSSLKFVVDQKFMNIQENLLIPKRWMPEVHIDVNTEYYD